MNLLKLSKTDNELLSGTGVEVLPVTTGRVVLVAGNEDAKELVNATEADLEASDSIESYASTLNFEDDLELFDEPRLVVILEELLLPENRAAYLTVMAVFSATIGYFDRLIIKGSVIGLEYKTAYLEPKLSLLSSHSSDFKAIVNALLQTFAMKDGVIILKDFNVRCWAVYSTSHDVLIQSLFTLAKLRRNRLIIETDSIDTLKSFTRVGKEADITCSLVTIQGNTPDNCYMLEVAKREYDDASLYASVLQIKEECL